MRLDVGLLDEACGQIARWRAAGHDLSMSVNVSMRQLEFEGFVDDVRVALATHGLVPDALVIEITEQEGGEDHDRLRQTLVELRQAGVRVAVDGAGNGVAAFPQIRDLAPDMVKLDRSVVSQVELAETRQKLEAATASAAQPGTPARTP